MCSGDEISNDAMEGDTVVEARNRELREILAAEKKVSSKIPNCQQAKSKRCAKSGGKMCHKQGIEDIFNATARASGPLLIKKSGGKSRFVAIK